MIKRKSVFVSFICVLLTAGKEASAQEFFLKGMAVNNAGKPAEYVSASLLKSDSTAVKQALTDSLGLFSLSAERGDYTLLLEQFGKEVLKKKILLSNNIDLGKIVIDESVMLKEVDIKSRRRLIEHQADRLVFNVESMVSASGGDAAELLSKIPGVKLQNSVISLVGKSTVNVMINDKPSLLTGEDLLNFLKSIPSDNILKVEVIANPPAKYSAEGNSGLINLVLKNPKQKQWDVALSSNYTQTAYARGTTGSNFNYQKNKLSVFGNINYGNGSRQLIFSSKMYYPDKVWTSSNPARYFTNGFNSNAGIDYKVSDKWSTGVQYLGDFFKNPAEGAVNVDLRSKATAPIDSAIKTLSGSREKNHIVAFSYFNKFILDSCSRTLYFSVDYFAYISDLNNDFSTNYFLPNGYAIPRRFYSANNTGLQNTQNISGQADLEFPTKWADLKLGGKISSTANKSEVAIYNTTDGMPVFVSSQSNRFQYEEHTQSLYVSGSKAASKKLEVQAGLRLENTQTAGTSLTLSERNANDYRKLFPTFYLLYKPDSLSDFSFNWNKRISRPSYPYMNPFRWYASSISYTEGNPFLQPSFSENFELSHTYKGNFSNKLYYTRLSEGFNQITLVEAGSNIQIFVPQNYINQYGLGFSSSYLFDKLSWLHTNNTLELTYNSAKSKIPLTKQELSGASLYFSTSNDFILNAKQTVVANLTYWYNTAGVYGLDKFSSYGELDASVRIHLMEKKLQLSLVCNDIFRTSITTMTAYSNDIQQDYYNYYASRLLRLSVRYKFGGKIADVKKNTFSNADEQDRTRQ